MMGVFVTVNMDMSQTLQQQRTLTVFKHLDHLFNYFRGSINSGNRAKPLWGARPEHTDQSLWHISESKL